ncbi:helix-turn-helix transcriptional regulator [Spongiibacter sp. KMU-166]|uniref:Helix-turn-helix transcriptional regulator n=2 Tax=Spongiibacter thalassae TaxID=2721624 RepID=A0ABX1GEP5_9GAMM|nr:helix-turn-helix transcriptional regulator [Spongiibacter thalassae]
MSTRTNNVHHWDFAPQAEGHAKGIDIDDVISELTKNNPGFAQHLTVARQRAAASYFSQDEGIRRLRLAAGLSQRELADIVGTAQPYIACLEAGGAEPKITTAAKIAKALNCTLTELLSAYELGNNAL